jgi:hypothetical protein
MSVTCRVLMSGVFAFGCAVALHAQAQTSKGSNTEIVTGCVERADEVAANASAATTVDSLTFMLIHAAKGPAADAPKGTSGTSDTRPVPKGSMYRLDGDVSTLNPHVGHKVEVAGTLVAPTTPSADAGDPTPANAPRIKVERVKMISETCDR